MLINENLELVKSREIVPLVDTIRAKLPMELISRLDMILADKEFYIEDETGEAKINGYLRDSATWAAEVTNFWTPYKTFWHRLHAAACDAERETAPAIGRIREACTRLMKEWFKRKQDLERRRQAQMDASADTVRKQSEKDAKEAALSGDVARAEELLRDAAIMRAPLIIPSVPKLDGTSITPKWVPTVEDQMALIKAVADGRIPLMHEVEIKGKTETRALLEVSNVVMKFYAKKLGRQLNWPGVTVNDDISFSTKRR